MQLNDLCKALDLSVITGDTNKEFNGVYVGDFLSRAMSCVMESDLWITIMSNTNVIAVASLTEASAIILAEDVELIEEAKNAAEQNGITVLSSSMTAYKLCVEIGKFTENAL